MRFVTYTTSDEDARSLSICPFLSFNVCLACKVTAGPSTSCQVVKTSGTTW